MDTITGLSLRVLTTRDGETVSNERLRDVSSVGSRSFRSVIDRIAVVKPSTWCAGCAGCAGWRRWDKGKRAERGEERVSDRFGPHPSSQSRKVVITNASIPERFSV